MATSGEIDNLTYDTGSQSLRLTNTTLSAGEDLTNNVQATAAKPTISADYSGSGAGAWGASSVAVAAKNAPALVKAVYATNTNAAVRYLQIFNKATAPVSSDVPVFSFYLPATSGVVEIGSEFFSENGFYLSTGLAIGISTVRGSYTAATAADHDLNYIYE